MSLRKCTQPVADILRRGFKPFGNRTDEVRRPTAEELAAFREHARHLTVAGLSYTAVVMFVLTAGAAPTDFLVFKPGSQEFMTLMAWRAVVIISCMALFAALRYSAWCRQRPYSMGMWCFTTAVAASGYLVGSYGGLESPLTYGIYSTPLLTVLLIVPPLERTVAAIWVVLVFAAGVMLPFPQHLHHPMIGAPAVWLCGVIATNVAVGHVVYTLLRANFLQHRSLDRRVAEQTSHIRELAASLLSTQERERRRIGHDLHDEFGQILTGLHMELERLDLIVGKPVIEPGRIQESLATSYDLLDAMHASFDQILRELRHPNFDGGVTFIEAVERLAAGVAARHGLVCDVIADAPVEGFSTQQATALYRIIQESLTNVARHARASQVVITLKQEDEHLRLTIADDGRGFDAVAAASEVRFGLAGITERSQWLGGDCMIDSTPGAGTTVAVTIPHAAESGRNQHDFSDDCR